MEWSREISRKLHVPFRANDLAEFRRMLSENPRQLRSKDGGEMWLWKAAADGNIPMLELLVELGLDVNETEYPPGDDLYEPDRTAIVQAASKGHVEAVRWLLDHGAKINFEFERQKRCESLVYAATQGHLEVVKLLIERGADLKAPRGGVFAVTQADIYGQFAIRDYLLSVGAKDARDITPPDFPAGHLRLIEAMVEGRGPLSDWHVEIPGDPAVTIHLIPANKKCDHDTLFTLGLSDINLPVGQYRFTHHELRIMLKRRWKLTDAALNDPKHNWPVEWLKRLVDDLRAGDRWPDEPILFMNGEPPEPLGPKTKLSGWLCLRSTGEVIELGGDRIANIHSLFAIHAEEAAFVRQNDTDHLVQLFKDRKTALYVDPKRKCAVK